MPTPMFLAAEWRYLAIINYEVDAELLRLAVPRGTELDAWQGRTYVSLVGSLFQRTKVLGVPIPFHRNFEEVNLRFYVRRRAAEDLEAGELRPEGAVEYGWRHGARWHQLRVRTQGGAQPLTAGSEAEFISEHNASLREEISPTADICLAWGISTLIASRFRA